MELWALYSSYGIPSGPGDLMLGSVRKVISTSADVTSLASSSLCSVRIDLDKAPVRVEVEESSIGSVVKIACQKR